MQYSNSNKSGNVEPNSHIKVSLSSFENGSEHVPSEHYPDQGNGDINWPFQFGVFLWSGDTQRKCQCSRNNDQLPTPEVDLTQKVAKHSSLQQPLQGVIHPCEDPVSNKGEDHRIGMQRPYPSESGIFQIEIQDRKDQLQFIAGANSATNSLNKWSSL